MFPEIKITKTTTPKQKPVAGQPLPFGRNFSDHMFVMDYVRGQGWINPRIEPYAPIEIEPAAMVFHYGQAVFEGLKAYKCDDGSINLFRPNCNYERMNDSNDRLVIPRVDVDFCVHATKMLVDLDKEWTINQNNFYSKCHLSPYNGKTCRGKAVATILAGNFVMKEGKVIHHA